MDVACDVFLIKLPTSKILKAKKIDDKRHKNHKLCFVDFKTMNETLESDRIADNSVAFRDPIRASITKQCLEGMDTNNTNRLINNNFNCNYCSNNSNGRQMDSSPSNRFHNIGKSQGLQSNNNNQSSSKSVYIKLIDIKLELKKIIDLERSDWTMACPIKLIANSKVEICNFLSKINSNQPILTKVDNPEMGCADLEKWDEDCYHRVELLEIQLDGTLKIAFVDDRTSNDIVLELRQIPVGQLQQDNPILVAFGNVKTFRNDNSFRFYSFTSCI